VLPGPSIEPAAISRPVSRGSSPGPWAAGPLLSVRARALLKTGIGQMRTTLFVCRLALPVCAVLFCGLHQAGAQGTTPVDVQQACTPDAMRLCSDTIPDVAKTTA